MSNYIGLDYSLGKSNVNRATGIHFGVISQNSINLDCTEDFEYDYGEPTCHGCGKPALPTPIVDPNGVELDETPDWYDGKDFYCDECEKCYWSDSVYSEESHGFSYESDGYKLTDCLDNDIFVLESPYYTFAQFCSPCVPGAGNLNTPVAEGAKTYCLGHDWFEDSTAPYPVYKVSDNSLVAA